MDGALFSLLFCFFLQISAGVAPIRYPQHAWIAGLIFWVSTAGAVACLLWYGWSNFDSLMAAIDSMGRKTAGGIITFVGMAVAILGLWLIAGPIRQPSVPTDSDYFFYLVDIRDPKDLSALLPVLFLNKSGSPFENADTWWAPWGPANPYPQDSTNPYWSIGHQMKVFFPVIRGGGMYGRSISAGDYLIQYDATFKGANYHFDERLNIQARDGVLTQKIDVWRTISGGDKTLVYSEDRP
jgi:hypothetical protein